MIPQITKATAEKLGLTPGCFSLHSDWDGGRKIAENTEKAEGNRNRPLRAPFPHYMGRGKVEGMLCLQHAAKERRKLDRD